LVKGFGMKIRRGVLGLVAVLAVSSALTGCGSDPESPATAGPPAGQATTTTKPAVPDPGNDSSGLAGITFPPGATVNDLGPNQKQYEVKGMTLEQVKSFFEDQLIGAGYTRAQEASASRFYDKGTKRIQVTWSDQQGTIRGVVRVTRS